MEPRQHTPFECNRTILGPRKIALIALRSNGTTNVSL